MTEDDRKQIAASHAKEVEQLGEFLADRMQTLERDSRELREENNELHDLNYRLGRLLTGVARGLKGEPEPNTAHSWHDLPELAVLMTYELNELRARHGNDTKKSGA
jgi:hypothetical protein